MITNRSASKRAGALLLLASVALAGCGTGGAAGGAGGSGGDGGTGGGAGQAGDDGGGIADAGSDAGPSFTPCPAAGSPCLVMPLGDSITDGFTPLPGGYRIELFHQTLLAHQAVSFVGRNMNGPTMVDNTPFPRNHEGYTGYTIDTAPAVGRAGITPLVDAAIAAGKPHIILLMIGTNDIDLSFDVANAPTRLGMLLDKIITDAPDALLAVAKIIPTRTDAENVRFQAYDDAIPPLVQARADAGKHIILVDNYAAFAADPNYKTTLMSDNLHPTPAGYAVLGQTWYAAIKAYIPVSP